jgi:chemotaxis protein MotB
MPPREKDPRKLKNPSEDQKTFGETDKDLDKLYIQEGEVEPIKHRGPTKVTGLNSQQKAAEDTKKDIKLRIVAEETKQQIDKILNSSPFISKVIGAVDTKTESDGLKIEIMDTDKSSMFESGSARIRPEAEYAFKQVVDVIKRYPNAIEIYGHTDSQAFPSRTGSYTNWELSADRANSARRLMETQGYPAARVLSVTGKASSEPRKPQIPLDPSNRRITLKLRFKTTTEFLRDNKVAPDYTDPLKDLLREESSKPAATKAPDAPAANASPAAASANPQTSSAVAAPGAPAAAAAAPPLATNPDYMPQDKIFEGKPLVSPKDIVF